MKKIDVTIEDLICDIDVTIEDLICKYAICTFPYGSHIYGTNSEKSDIDSIYVVDDQFVEKLDDQYVFHSDFDPVNKTYTDHFHEINISIYGKTTFQKMCDDHHISALECIFLPDDLIKDQISDYKFKFELNLQRLRKSISEKTSHSWVKAKKKFEIEDDRNVYIAKKSLFHSMRIIDFGTQIAKSGKIENYHSCIELWNEIKDNPSEIWKDYETKYKSKFNQMMSEFRKVAPK